jgi:5'-nucleotidase
MESQWGRVVTGVHSHHPHRQPRSSVRPESGEGSSPGWADWTAGKLRERRAKVPPLNDDDSDNESSEHDEDAKLIDKELAVMRRVFRKWCRKAGIEERLCDELTEEECQADWTRAIAPQLEGRICIVEGTES